MGKLSKTNSTNQNKFKKNKNQHLWIWQMRFLHGFKQYLN